MKLQANRAESFIKGMNSNINSAFICGEDTGTIENLSNLIIEKILGKNFDPINLLTISKESFEENPSIIAEEMLSISLLGGRKLIRLRGVETDKEAAENIIYALEKAKQTKSDSFLLIIENEVKSNSALANAYDNMENGVIIPIYEPDKKDLSAKVASVLRGAGIKFENGVDQYIAESCFDDSQILLTQLEKIIIYLGSEKNLTIETVQKLVGNTSEASIQEICDAAIEQNKAKLLELLYKTEESGIAEILILRSMVNYVEKLHSVLEVIEDGKPVDEAIRFARPPVFWKQVPTFKNHLNIVKKKGKNYLWSFYKSLYLAEMKMKESGSEPSLLLQRGLLNLDSNSYATQLL